MEVFSRAETSHAAVPSRRRSPRITTGTAKRHEYSQYPPQEAYRGSSETALPSAAGTNSSNAVISTPEAHPQEAPAALHRTSRNHGHTPDVLPPSQGQAIPTRACTSIAAPLAIVATQHRAAPRRRCRHRDCDSCRCSADHLSPASGHTIILLLFQLTEIVLLQERSRSR